MISIDGSPPVDVSGPGNTHFISGLNFGDTVEASILAKGKFPCGNSEPSSPVTCYAIECQPITFNKTPDTTLCYGDSLILNITDIFSVSGQYEIFLAGISRGKDSVFWVKPEADTILNIRITDAFQPQCPAAEKIFSVNVIPLPDISIFFSPADTLCEVGILTLQGNPGFDRYLFYKNTAVLADTTVPFFDYSSYSNQDIFKIEAIENGCKNSNPYKKLIVLDSLLASVPNCGNSTVNSVTFFWTEAPGATGYEISIDNGVFKDPDSEP